MVNSEICGTKPLGVPLIDSKKRLPGDHPTSDNATHNIATLAGWTSRTSQECTVLLRKPSDDVDLVVLVEPHRRDVKRSAHLHCDVDLAQ